MMSNARVPGLSSLPAGLSPVVVQVLRTTLGFTGLIVTDSLSAGAISALHLAEPAASVMAIAAGDDLILYGSPSSTSASLALASKISSAIVNAVERGNDVEGHVGQRRRPGPRCAKSGRVSELDDDDVDELEVVGWDLVRLSTNLADLFFEARVLLAERGDRVLELFARCVIVVHGRRLSHLTRNVVARSSP